MAQQCVHIRAVTLRTGATATTPNAEAPSDRPSCQPEGPAESPA